MEKKNDKDLVELTTDGIELVVGGGGAPAPAEPAPNPFTVRGGAALIQWDEPDFI